jgi:hypothetical protein
LESSDFILTDSSLKLLSHPVISLGALRNFNY